MQFQRKRMNQTWENGKKTSFSSLFDPNAGPKIFFHGFYLNWVLDIAASYHSIQFQGKLTKQTWENGQKK